jgi:hypothetical protein
MKDGLGLIMPFANRLYRRRAALACALGAAMGLTSAAALAQAERPAPRLDQLKKTRLSVDTGKQQQIWAAVMKTLGPFDQKEKCWTLETRGRRFCMQPAKFAMRGANDKNDYYFAITGRDYQASALKTGVAMFMRFSTGGDDKGFVFKELDGLYEFGSRLAPLGDHNFRFVEVAIDTYAWEVTDSYVVAGADVEMTTLIHMGGVFTPKQRRMADFVTFKGNEKTCGGDRNIACVSNRLDYGFRPGAGGLFSLEMTLKRKTGPKKIFALDDMSPVLRSDPFTIPFDSREGRYTMPSEDMVDWLGRRLPAKFASQP